MRHDDEELHECEAGLMRSLACGCAGTSLPPGVDLVRQATGGPEGPPVAQSSSGALGLPEAAGLAAAVAGGRAGRGSACRRLVTSDRERVARLRVRGDRVAAVAASGTSWT